MGRRRVGKGGFIHDLHNLVWRICDEKKITLQELEEAVGASPKAFSQIKQSTELNWRMFKKLVLEVYPMALFDDDPEKLRRYLDSLKQSRPARALPKKSMEEEIIDGLESPGKTTRSDAKGQKVSTQEKHARSIPPGGIKKH